MFDADDLEIDVLTSVPEFEKLQEDWQDLYDDAPSVTPFQSWAWSFSWWEHYGSSCRLRLITVRECGQLVGLMPAMLAGGFASRRLLLVGTGLSDYLDVIVRAGWEESVCSALSQFLGRGQVAKAIDLQQLRESATARRLYDLWPGPRATYVQARTPVMTVRPWDDIVAGLPAKRRETARKTIRRLEQDRLTWRRVEVDAVDAATVRWLELHREYWRGRSITPEHESERFAACMSSAARRLVESGAGAVYELARTDSDVVEAADLVLTGKDFVMGYVSGAADRLHRRIEVNTALVHLWNSVALEASVSEVDLGRGLEPYKLKWAPMVRENQRLALGVLGARWWALAGYLAMRQRLAGSVRARNAMRHIAGVRGRSRSGLRAGVSDIWKRVQRSSPGSGSWKSRCAPVGRGSPKGTSGHGRSGMA